LAVNQTLNNELKEARLKVEALQKQQEKLESRLKE
jgi:chaperonin cofactor prefoldin